MSGTSSGQAAWEEAALVAALFATDPARLQGIWMQAKAGPVRDHWLEYLRSLLPGGVPFGKLPLNVTDESLFGGADLAGTLASAKLVWRPGLLTRLNGGLLLIPLAELLPQALSAQLSAVLDRGELVMEQGSRSSRSDVMLNVIAFDESEPGEIPQAAALRDRLAFHADLPAVGIRETVSEPFCASDIVEARSLLPRIQTPDAILAGLCRASIELGISSIRGPMLALAAARASAALHGREIVTAEDAAAAARFVLAPRATIAPALEAGRPESPGQGEGNKPDGANGKGDSDGDAEEFADIILEAARATLPPNLLSIPRRGPQRNAFKGQGGRSGIERMDGQRGRPRGVRRARGATGEKISAVDTIRAAAPWQTLRRQSSPEGAAKFHARKDDLRVRRYKSFAQTTTIFAVDASGSSALQRLSEAKGAVELLLADCYVRRDRVALIAFRGHEASILLPPTRSLVRAKRALNGLAGGGGTPLAAGIRAAAILAARTKRDGGAPIVVVLTDGRANIAANGQANRETAHNDAIRIAQCLRKEEIPALLVDTSPRPQPKAGQLAREMGALYLPLPYANARSISAAARSMAAP